MPAPPITTNCLQAVFDAAGRWEHRADVAEQEWQGIGFRRDGIDIIAANDRAALPKEGTVPRLLAAATGGKFR